MDAYQVLTEDRVGQLTQKSFDALTAGFRKGYLESANYAERVRMHRRPDELREELRRDVAGHLQTIQQRPEMRHIDHQKNAAGYVPTVIKTIWINNKNLRTCFAALEVYCRERALNLNVIGVHLAEYKAMDRLFRILGRTKAAPLKKPAFSKTIIGISSRYYEPFRTLSQMIDADYHLPTRYNDDRQTTSFAYLYSNYSHELDSVSLSQKITARVTGYLRDNLYRPDEIKLLLQALLPLAQSFGERSVTSMNQWADRATLHGDHSYAGEVRLSVDALLLARKFIYQNLLEYYSNLYPEETISTTPMKTKAQIQEMVLDFFRRTHSRAGHVVHMNVFRQNLLYKLNPKEQELYATGLNELITKGYILHETSIPECLRLTEKGYDRIYDDNFTEEEPLPVIQKKELPTVDFPDRLYADVLQTLATYGKDLETKPKVFGPQDEEGLRDHFLSALTARYERTTATGETFNRKGKTDILLKDDQGNNIFIAECKWWKGPGVFHSTISQLFDNYVTWRDTKLAILFFVPNKDFSNVLDQIEREAAQHAYFVRFISRRDDSRYSFVFRQKDDANHEVKLEIMLFHFAG
jgi:hypothetical protein